MPGKNAALLAGLDRDIIRAEEAERARQSQMLQTQKRRAVLTKHDRVISQGRDGMWRTRVRLPDGRVRQIVRLTEGDLLDALAEHYDAIAEAVTLRSAFTAWIEWKRSRGKVTEQTLTRYANHFARYFKKDGGDAFADSDLRAATPADMDDLIARLARSPGLTGRQYRELRIVLKGALTYARDHGLIDLTAADLLGGVREGEIDFRDDPEPADPQVFTDEEESALLAYFAEHPDRVHLGLVLLFRSGLRVGELSALRRECVSVKNLTISIRATEVQYRDTDGKTAIAVQEFPKTASGRREVVLPSEAAATLRTIRSECPFGEWFLAYPDGTRIRSQAYRRALRRACVAVGIPPRSTHKIRATYATELLDARVSEASVQAQLGHADVATTRRIYYRNRKTAAETRAELDAVFGGR